MLTDDVGVERWMALFAQWRTCCGAMLRRYFAREAAAEFYSATRVRDHPPAPWRPALRAAVKAIEDMIELFVMLRATLQRRGGPSR
ncbi:MAG TPA: hypothetical protein VNZ01_14845 [Solirubrobacteraceae bacterium]|nr:hypothetical protein [Solirubrobacteraceae bacterium]